MNGFYLERKDPERNIHRFYKVVFIETLFGEWTLLKEWGRIGSPGTLQKSWFATAEVPNQAAFRLIKTQIALRLCSPQMKLEKGDYVNLPGRL